MSRSFQSILDEFDYGFNEDQQNFIKDNWDKLTLKEVGQKVYRNPDIYERSPEIKPLVDYIRKIKRNHPQVDMTPEQMQQVDDLAGIIGPVDIARKIFNNERLAPLSKEVKAVSKYIQVLGKEVNVAPKKEVDIGARAMSKLLAKVNKARPGIDLKEEKLTGLDKRFLDQLNKYINAPRFLSTINTIRNEQEKDLFESEFINGVYAKDLNAEDINMYISLCSDYVQRAQIQRQLEILNDELETAASDEDGKSLKMTLVEMYGKKSTELDQCSKRIKSLQDALSQNYSKRMESKASLSASLVAFVELWKEEEKRKQMIMVAEAGKEEVKREIQKMSNAAEYIAKVLGISEEEILNG